MGVLKEVITITKHITGRLINLDLWIWEENYESPLKKQKVAYLGSQKMTYLTHYFKILSLYFEILRHYLEKVCCILIH